MEALDQKVNNIVGWISTKKGEKIFTMDVSKKSSFTDFFVICSGNGTLHTQAIAQSILDGAKEEKYHLLGKEGLTNSSWILLDFGDVVVHIFDDPVRDYYKLEDLWNKLPVRTTENSLNSLVYELEENQETDPDSEV